MHYILKDTWLLLFGQSVMVFGVIYWDLSFEEYCLLKSPKASFLLQPSHSRHLGGWSNYNVGWPWVKCHCIGCRICSVLSLWFKACGFIFSQMIIQSLWTVKFNEALYDWGHQRQPCIMRGRDAFQDICGHDWHLCKRPSFTFQSKLTVFIWFLKYLRHAETVCSICF